MTTTKIDDPFIYTTQNGKTIRVKKQREILTVGFVRRNRALMKSDEEEAAWLMLEQAADEKNLELVDALTIEEFQEFLTKWAETAPRTAGES